MKQVSQRKVESTWVEAEGDGKALEWVWGDKTTSENGEVVELRWWLMVR